ncbi:MAG: xylose isomerase [Planctomycetota bacterium]|nr:MAG: xylose isomerase [Planctomycetota bacterium]
MLAIGYNTNGFAHHTLEDCLAILADLGYDGVALTLDVHHLDPFATSAAEVAALARRLDALGLRRVVETGARYVLDPRRKHWPSLVSEGRERRVALLARAVAIGAELGAEAVSVHSGPAEPGLPAAEGWERLRAGMLPVLEHAERCGIPVGFEPEPGQFIDRLEGFDRLREMCGPGLRLTLDLGHVRCTEGFPPEEAVRRYAGCIVNVHAEDIRGREHVHLPFGEGDLDLRPALGALVQAGYRGLVNVELSRHSHDAPRQAERSLSCLRALLAPA